MAKTKKTPKVSILDTAEYKELRNDYVRLQLKANHLARLVTVDVPEKKPLLMSKDAWNRKMDLFGAALQVLSERSNLIEYAELTTAEDTQSIPQTTTKEKNN